MQSKHEGFDMLFAHETVKMCFKALQRVMDIFNSSAQI